MSRDELKKAIVGFSKGYFTIEHIMSAVDAYSEAINGAKPIVSGNVATFSKCPECGSKVGEDELQMFGGICEECSGAFDE